MTDQDSQLYNLTRRKVLAGLGAVGLASAGAGLGTTAFFSDQETYLNNTLMAGALDLSVDWEEHYYFGQPDSYEGLDVSMTDPQDDAYVGLPNPADPRIWVHEDDLDAFMDNTTLESYPDADNNRVQDDLEAYVPCVDFAQLQENLNPDTGRGAGVRSANMDTILNYSAYMEGDAAVPAPLVNLHDVKPGDFGELTLSMHLCDNPGYIWMNGQLVSADENGVTEPESKDPDEQDGVVELLDAVQTMMWYDEDGDNVYEPGGVDGDVDIVLVIDDSGSMGSSDPNSGSKLANAKAGARTFVDAVGPAAQIGVVSFDNAANTDLGLTSVGGNEVNIKNAIDGISGGSTTNIEDGIETGSAVLNGTGARSGASQVMILLSDGEPTAGTGTDAGNISPVQEAATAKASGIEIFTIGYGISSGSSFAATLEAVASAPTDSHAYLDVDVDTPQEIEAVFGQIGQIIAGEELFFEGSLRELLEALDTDLGIPLDGVRATAFDEVDGDNLPTDGDGTGREAYVDCTVNAIGLAWWLPVDHANEIQTDSVTFDLGFYTEQARHNTGAGQTA